MQGKQLFTRLLSFLRTLLRVDNFPFTGWCLSLMNSIYGSFSEKGSSLKIHKNIFVWSNKKIPKYNPVKTSSSLNTQYMYVPFFSNFKMKTSMVFFCCVFKKEKIGWRMTPNCDILVSFFNRHNKNVTWWKQVLFIVI